MLPGGRAVGTVRITGPDYGLPPHDEAAVRRGLREGGGVRFDEAKAWHGLGRFRLRGLAKVNVEARLMATGQNLKCLLSEPGWGRRPWPSGEAGLVLPSGLPAPGALR
jgi:hypothetical protein